MRPKATSWEHAGNTTYQYNLPERRAWSPGQSTTGDELGRDDDAARRA